jgi:hypothetical protein
MDVVSMCNIPDRISKIYLYIADNKFVLEQSINCTYYITYSFIKIYFFKTYFKSL